MTKSFLTALCVISLCALASSPLAARKKAPVTYSIQLPPAPDYSSVDWLAGDWAGRTRGHGSQGQVLLSVSYALDKRFMIFREELSLPAVKGAPATHESLMGILSSGASGYVMDLYSSNGFITRYRVTIEHGEIDFNPEGGAVPPSGWLFRRVIKHTNGGECTESVDAAPPGKRFFNYYTADLSQVTPASSGGSKAAAKKRNGGR